MYTSNVVSANPWTPLSSSEKHQIRFAYLSALFQLIYKISTPVWIVVLYRSETWTIRKNNIKRSVAFKMWIRRRMERVSWMEHRTN